MPPVPALGGRRELSKSKGQRSAAREGALLLTMRWEPSPRPRRWGPSESAPSPRPPVNRSEPAATWQPRARVEKFPLDAFFNGWFASVCVRIFPGSRLQVIPSPS